MCQHTTLNENVQALFHSQANVELDQAKTKWKDFITSAHSQEVSDSFLSRSQNLHGAVGCLSSCHLTKPALSSLSMGRSDLAGVIGREMARGLRRSDGRTKVVS